MLHGGVELIHNPNSVRILGSVLDVLGQDDDRRRKQLEVLTDPSGHGLKPRSGHNVDDLGEGIRGTRLRILQEEHDHVGLAAAWIHGEEGLRLLCSHDLGQLRHSPCLARVGLDRVGELLRQFEEDAPDDFELLPLVGSIRLRLAPLEHLDPLLIVEEAAMLNLHSLASCDICNALHNLVREFFLGPAELGLVHEVLHELHLYLREVFLHHEVHVPLPRELLQAAVHLGQGIADVARRQVQCLQEREDVPAQDCVGAHDLARLPVQEVLGVVHHDVDDFPAEAEFLQCDSEAQTACVVELEVTGSADTLLTFCVSVLLMLVALAVGKGVQPVGMVGSVLEQEAGQLVVL